MKLVALLGPDGAGKSTVIRALADALGETKVEVRHFRVALRHRRPTVTDPYRKSPHAGPVALAKVVWWHVSHGIWGISMAFRRTSANGTLVVFDRFLYDIQADPLRYRIPAWVGRLPWRRVVWPRPDLAVILEPPVEVVRARKREVSRRETSLQLAAYRGLDQLSCPVLRISDETSAEQVAVHILQALDRAH